SSVTKPVLQGFTAPQRAPAGMGIGSRELPRGRKALKGPFGDVEQTSRGPLAERKGLDWGLVRAGWHHRMVRSHVITYGASSLWPGAFVFHGLTPSSRAASSWGADWHSNQAVIHLPK